MSPKILIVDDHAIVLKGLCQIVVETFGDGCRITTAATAARAMELAATGGYDICLLDIGLPGAGGLQLLTTLRDRCPDMRIIVNTVHDELWHVKEYIEAGVEGILFKNVDSGEIAKALRTVNDGGIYYCRRALDIRNRMDRYDEPTPREKDVLAHIATGRKTEEIAQIMGISVNTVETHRRHLLDKLNARNMAEMIMNAVSRGLIPIDKTID